MVECASRSIIRGGFTLVIRTTLGSGTTLGGGGGGWHWKVRTGTGRGRDETSSEVGGDRVVYGIQLEKSSRRLEMAKSCLWWMAAGTSFMAHERNLSTWTMRSEGYTVGLVRLLWSN